MFDLKNYEIYSEKYKIKAIITQLFNKAGVAFLYDKTFYSCPIEKQWPEDDEEAIKALGIEAMENHMKRILMGEVQVEKVRLFNWYTEKIEKHGKEYIIVWGNVIGHYRLCDSDFIHTSPVESIEIQEETGEVVICTCNTRYYCLLNSWNFEKQDKNPEAFRNYAQLKEKYQVKNDEAPIEPGKVLLSISNYDSYYFHSFYYMPEDATKPLEYMAYPHIGSFQDSYLIFTQDRKVDLRYFPHSENIEFYSEYTTDKPWFIENVGTTKLYAKTSVGIIKLEPGERKEVRTENTEDEKVFLSGKDLYPAGII